MVELVNDQKAWAFGSGQYVREAVQNVVTYLKKRGDVLGAKAPTPMSCGYRPEIDVTPELDQEDSAYYQSLIGIQRWIVELGRVDINVEVSIHVLTFGFAQRRTHARAFTCVCISQETPQL